MVTSAALGLLLAVAASTQPDATATSGGEQDPASAAPPAAQANEPGKPEVDADIDVNAPEPPPSAYDRRQAQQAQGTEPEQPPPGEDFSLWEQLVQTVVALAIVVGLIYLFGRTILPRLAGMRFGGAAGRVLTVLERLQLDNRHALVVVRVEGIAGDRTLLLSTGEGGVQLVANLTETSDAPAPDRGDGFKEALKKAAQAQTPPEAGTDD